MSLIQSVKRLVTFSHANPERVIINQNKIRLVFQVKINLIQEVESKMKNCESCLQKIHLHNYDMTLFLFYCDLLIIPL